ncbi:MAG: alpha-L-arabinofuranosidase, partial [Chloroflexota bacterium]|nr:alpha-L-arabinofuranosidase [Chloroflexota bacterium]
MQEALDLLEYCNHPGGTYLSDLRRSHGSEEPYDIRMWCLGNEMDGTWQLGHKTPYEYGRLAAEVARAMRRIDAGLELVACGSSNAEMATFGKWEAVVLEEAYDQVDYISAHAYYELTGGDVASFLASPVNMDRFIDDVVATCDYVRAKTSHTKRINISFDEWNVWYIERLFETNRPPFHLPHDWMTTPRVSEDAYTVADAVVVGGLLITLLRHSDRVTSACQAQLVNCGSMIRTEPGGRAWRQAIFHPFAQAARYAKGMVLRVVPKAPVIDTAKHGEVLVLDAVATYDEDTDELVVFAVNRHQSEAVELTVDARAFDGHRVLEHSVLADADLEAANTEAQPDRVRPRPVSGATVDGGRLTAMLPPVSWNVLRLEPLRD